MTMTEIVGARIEGIRATSSDTDAVENLGYEVEYTHTACFEAGLALFKEVHEYDRRLMSWELDAGNPPTCPICKGEITCTS